MDSIVKEDMQSIAQSLGPLVDRFSGCRVLITGFRGFLGVNFLAFFNYINNYVLRNAAHVTCVDNGTVDLDDQTAELIQECEVIIDNAANVTTDGFVYIINCAGIASPSFYRRFPLETIEANAISLWSILQRLNGNTLKGFLYFSSSEIYGDPSPDAIPTQEDYRGNVSCTGPRACYDESKRLGETICITFTNEKGLPIKIVRPFNAYGPFMRLDDRRVIPDFIKSALKNKVIEMYSNGKPTRTFCYVRDLIEGCLRVLLLGGNGRSYNLGNPENEISIQKLAEKIAALCSNARIQTRQSTDENYLSDNPQRRCPSIDRAKKEVGYAPKVSLEEGLKRMIAWHGAVSGMKGLEVG